MIATFGRDNSMNLRRAISLFAGMAVIAVVSAWPCYAERGERKKDDIWTEAEPDKPGERRLELTNEEVNRIMESLRKSDPAKAQELEELRNKDPQKFQAELRKHGGDEFGKIVGERIEGWRRRRQEEFVNWLSKNFRKEAEELNKVKEKDPDEYDKRFDAAWNQFSGIYETDRRNPELGKILKEDFELKKKRHEIIDKLKTANDANKTKALVEQLERVVADRYDLIAKRKQIIYEQLLKRLKDLERQVEKSKDDVRKLANDKNKCENVKKRLQHLMEEISKSKTDK